MDKELISGFIMRRRFMGNRSSVPVSYTFHDWIQCDATVNTSYINTELIPNLSKDWTFEGSFARTTSIPSDYKKRALFMRLLSDGYGCNYGILYKAKNESTIVFNYNSRYNNESYAGVASTSIIIGEWHTFQLTSDPDVDYGGKCTIDGGDAIIYKDARPNSNTTAEMVLLCGYPCRFGRFKSYYQGNLVADMIPATRDTDNAVGMYDVVRKKFFQPIGTSSFTCGDGLTNFF